MNTTNNLKSDRFKKLFISPNNLKSAVVYRIPRLLDYLFDLIFSFIENSMGLLISLDWRNTHKTSENILVCRNKKYSLQKVMKRVMRNIKLTIP